MYKKSIIINLILIFFIACDEDSPYISNDIDSSQYTSDFHATNEGEEKYSLTTRILSTSDLQILPKNQCQTQVFMFQELGGYNIKSEVDFQRDIKITWALQPTFPHFRLEHPHPSINPIPQDQNPN